jgi:hypothetical protein
MKNISHTKVDSSHVSSVGYDQEDQVLEVKFKNGTTYRYLDVSPNIHQDILKADSVGKFLHGNLRDHAYHRLEEG